MYTLVLTQSIEESESLQEVSVTLQEESSRSRRKGVLESSIVPNMLYLTILKVDVEKRKESGRRFT